MTIVSCRIGHGPKIKWPHEIVEMMPLSLQVILSLTQKIHVLNTANTLPKDRREKFLRAVARHLGCMPSDKTVVTALKQVKEHQHVN
jgi:hypothetical protein